MIKNILFDLDGTLLPMDQDEFAQEYFKQLSMRIAHVAAPKLFIKQLLDSTAVMIANKDYSKTNEQVFKEDFLAKIGVPEEIIMPIFDNFYEKEFSCIQHVTKKNDYARSVVTTIINSGLDVVVATNPLFPLSGIRQRLSWVGLDDVNFKHITSYEQSHYCKPHPEYYLEIAEQIGCRPQECLMIGNDVAEDLVAGTVGMRTYLVTDCLINVKGIEPKADYVGTFADLAQDINKLITDL